MTRPRVGYIGVSTELLGHWKVELVADRLGIVPAQVVGHLVGLWSFAANATAESQADGDLSRFSPSMLERRAGWSGEAGALWQALLQAQLVDADGRLHDWAEHAGRGIASMTAGRDRMRVRRASGASAGDSVRTVREQSGQGVHTVREQSGPGVSTRDANGADLIEREIETKGNPPVAPPRVATPMGVARRSGTDLVAADDGGEASDTRRALWGAFDLSMGVARTTSERGRRARAVTDLLHAGVTPDEVRLAIEAWPRVMRDATLTETGIASHVGRLTAGVQAKAPTRDSRGQLSDTEVIYAVTEQVRREREEAERERVVGALSGRNGAVAVLAAPSGRG